MSGKTIDEWHDRLHDHFLALRQKRAQLNRNSPVFAIEHGLNVHTELPDLKRAVQKVIARGHLPTVTWLPLVVYAAEIGYRYRGDRYWPRFEQEFPNWRQLGNKAKNHLHDKYKLFAQTYGGARPSGTWASHFKFIAWPITHAILPTDLQRHLARLLYDYRKVLTRELLEDQEELGKRLAARSHETSDRFKHFAENSSLLGLVAVSLLHEEDETPLIANETLARITTDLSSERQAGNWLRDTKQAVVRVRLKGFKSKPGTKHDERHAITADQQWPSLEPTLSLCRLPTGWTAYVTVPSYASLAERFPGIREEPQNVCKTRFPVGLLLSQTLSKRRRT